MHSDPFVGDPVRLADEAPAAIDCLTLLFGGDRRRAQGLLARRSLAELRAATPEEWARDLGVDAVEASQVAAAVSLGRLGTEPPRRVRPYMRSARRIYELLKPDLAAIEQETFMAVLLDGKYRLRRVVRVSVGTLTTSLVHPREVFRPAIRAAAAALIVAHNHPSGDPEPSGEDFEVTTRLRDVGELVGIPLLDHVIVGDGTFVSLRERMDFGRPTPPERSRHPRRGN